MINAWQPDIVIYHHPCADGFTAAWACHTRWPDAEYVPAGYGDAPPDVTGKRVLIVDFSFKEPVLRAMGECALSVVVLDHHKTAAADLEPFTSGPPGSNTDLAQFRAMVEHYEGHPAWPANIFAFFDMGKSGARLAWEFARPAASIPPIVQYVEDRDLWRFHLPESRAVSAWLRTKLLNFAEWDFANDLLRSQFGFVAAEGQTMLAYYDVLVSDIVKTATPSPSSRTPVIVNCPGIFASDVGNALLKAHPAAPYAITYSDGADGFRHYSLRSEEGREDVSEIAKSHGGGGHRNAAGYRVPAPPVMS